MDLQESFFVLVISLLTGMKKYSKHADLDVQMISKVSGNLLETGSGGIELEVMLQLLCLN